MGQKCNPISNRLGIIRGWDSNWFGGKNYGDKLVEDYKIRKYRKNRYRAYAEAHHYHDQYRPSGNYYR